MRCSWGLFELSDERPRCACHGLPKILNGTTPSGTQKYRCQVAEQERQRRRIKISIANELVHVGYVPTVEAADRLRRMIREEAPRGQA